MGKGFACRDCALCTGSAFTGMARGAKRAAATVGTLGIAKLVRKTCDGCTHPMAEHRGQQAEVVQTAQPVQQAVVPQAPVSSPPGWYPDPVDPDALTWWDGTRWRPETKRFPDQ